MKLQSIIQKQLDDFNSHDTEGFVSIYTNNATCYDPFYDQPLKGKKAILRDLTDFIVGFPDFKGKITGNILIHDHTAAFEIELAGTHKGNLQSPGGVIPPTNRNIRILMGRFLQFTNGGKIVADNRYYDTMSIMVQLGLMPMNP
ncbi:MAG TPA: ester cyclase [Saprospiraceae bacterium]|nr:ester cyclase [Saprospiraceae bacterium]